jgi:hypothetical protein
MKKVYVIILGLTAILLAATAAYFSVFGLSKLFLGASISVIIMAAILEFSKVVSVTFLHQYWSKIATTLKFYLFTGVIILMIITSAGIYGFLSDAYSSVSVELEKIKKDVEFVDKKIEIKDEEKNRLNEQMNMKNDRITSLINIRKSQETRLDSLYARGQITSAKRTETIIKDADENIKMLTEEINTISSQIYIINDSISKYEIEKLNTINNDLSGEVAPLKYIADITGTHINKVVNWLIILLIIVFDPMAVALIISTSSMVKMINQEKDKKNETQNKIMSYISDENEDFKTEEEVEKKSDTIELKKDVDNIKENEIYVNELSGVIELDINTNEQHDAVLENHKTDNTNTECEIDVVTNMNNIQQEEIEDVDNIQNEVVDVDNIQQEEIEDVDNIQNETVVGMDNIQQEEIVDVNNIQKEVVENVQDTPIINVSNDIPINVTEEKSSNDIVDDHKINQEVSKQSLYLKLLKIFYNNGSRKSGDQIPNYFDFKKDINANIPNLIEKEVKDFLVVCNLFKITRFNNNIGFFEKDYMDAFYLISKI